MSKTQIEIPPKLIPVFTTPNVRYRSSWGGRGSGKTRTFALMTAIKGYMFAELGVSGTVLCAREFMNTLADSSMEEIKQAIRSVPFLANYYEMGENYIRTKNKNVTYSFCGLRHNLDSIKSKARILLCWVDEAETVSEVAYRKLLPTVREEITMPDGTLYISEIWLTWNPERRDSPTSTRFRHDEILDPETGELIGMCAEMNYTDNPWFPHVLELERKRDLANLDDVTYRWIWEGAYLEMSEAQIFKGKYERKDFTPDPQKWNGPYIGLDFGFSQDPTACVKVWIHDDSLWIEHEGGKVGLELDDTVEYLKKKIPDIHRYTVYADSARPESISHLKKKGLPRIRSVEKGKGSVEDGIEFIKSFKRVYIHSRCKETLNEFRDYSYKKDRLTDEVLPIIIDKNNHYIDALRYSIEKVMKRGMGLNINISDIELSLGR
nr:MAG: terminase large subunit [Caudoviricetes sp.]